MMTFQAFLFILFFIFFMNHEKMIISAKRIIGGEMADLGELPYMAIVGNETLFCSGAIISPKYILTGAQCIHLKMKHFVRDVRVHVGTLHPSGGDVHFVKHASVHPEFLKNYPNKLVYDIGLLTLCKQISFDSEKRPVKLPTYEVQDGNEAVVSGWGSFGFRNIRQRLMKVTMKVYNFQTCSKDDDLALEIKNESQICAMDVKTKGVCDIDQGGPLVINGMIIGVASLRQDIRCARGKVIFTSVHQSLNYIKNEILTCRNLAFTSKMTRKIESK